MTEQEFLRRLRLAIEETKREYANNQDVQDNVIAKFERVLERAERRSR